MITSKITNVQNHFDNICNCCIEFLELYATGNNITYGELNVILFCIIIPFFLIGYFVTMCLQKLQFKKLANTLFWIMIFLTIVTIITFICGLFIPFFIQPC